MTPEMRDAHELVESNDERVLLVSLGKQIRKLRLSKHLTVAELAKASSTSLAMVSKIENGLTSASLGTLHRLADALGTSITSLFSQYEKHNDISYVKSGEGLEIERRGTRAGHHYTLLGHNVRGEVDIEPYLITLTAESDVFSWFQHSGVEFIHVLEGEMDYRHGEEIFALSPGDSLLFDPQSIHGPEKLKSFPIKFLAVICYAKD